MVGPTVNKEVKNSQFERSDEKNQDESKDEEKKVDIHAFATYSFQAKQKDRNDFSGNKFAEKPALEKIEEENPWNDFSLKKKSNETGETSNFGGFGGFSSVQPSEFNTQPNFDFDSQKKNEWVSTTNKDFGNAFQRKETTEENFFNQDKGFGNFASNQKIDVFEENKFEEKNSKNKSQENFGKAKPNENFEKVSDDQFSLKRKMESEKRASGSYKDFETTMQDCSNLMEKSRNFMREAYFYLNEI